LEIPSAPFAATAEPVNQRLASASKIGGDGKFQGILLHAFGKEQDLETLDIAGLGIEAHDDVVTQCSSVSCSGYDGRLVRYRMSACRSY